MPRDPAPHKRVFSYNEARTLLPEVRRLTEDAYHKVEALRADALARQVSGAELQGRLESVVRAWAQVLVAKGLEVKGLWLVDFDNGSGYYCWSYPEAGLEFYHSYEEGFRGRLRIQ